MLHNVAPPMSIFYTWLEILSLQDNHVRGQSMIQTCVSLINFRLKCFSSLQVTVRLRGSTSTCTSCCISYQNLDCLFLLLHLKDGPQTPCIPVHSTDVLPSNPEVAFLCKFIGQMDGASFHISHLTSRACLCAVKRGCINPVLHEPRGKSVIFVCKTHATRNALDPDLRPKSSGK